MGKNKNAEKKRREAEKVESRKIGTEPGTDQGRAPGSPHAPSSHKEHGKQPGGPNRNR